MYSASLGIHTPVYNYHVTDLCLLWCLFHSFECLFFSFVFCLNYFNYLSLSCLTFFLLFFLLFLPSYCTSIEIFVVKLHGACELRQGNMLSSLWTVWALAKFTTTTKIAYTSCLHTTQVWGTLLCLNSRVQGWVPGVTRVTDSPSLKGFPLHVTMTTMARKVKRRLWPSILKLMRFHKVRVSLCLLSVRVQNALQHKATLHYKHQPLSPLSSILWCHAPDIPCLQSLRQS